MPTSSDTNLPDQAQDATTGLVEPQPSPAHAATQIQPDTAGADAPHQPSILSTALLGLGSMVLMVTVFRMLKKSAGARANRPHQIETPRETIARERSQVRSACEPLENMMADADELAMRLARILDAKAARLEVLIADADARLEALGKEIPTRKPQQPEDTPAPLQFPQGSIDERVLDLADQGSTTEQIASELGINPGQVELILAVGRRLTGGE